MSSIAIGIVILIVIVAAIVIYFVIVNNETPQYPISIFNYDETVNITPITLTKNGTILNTNQYLQKVTTGDPSCINKQGDGYNNMGPNACVALFTGNADDPQSKWILRRYRSDGSGDADQSLKSGYGNRFYMQNSTQPNQSAVTGRLLYSPLNFFITRVNSCAYTTAATIGYDGESGGLGVGFSTEMLLYFMPTSYKDIYYILFPACLDSAYNNNNMPNNGIISIRPWADNAGQYILDETNCAACPPGGTYTPYNNGVLYPNAMIANLLPNNGKDTTLPYSYANIVLFKITIAG